MNKRFRFATITAVLFFWVQAARGDFRIIGPEDALRVVLETRTEGRHAVVQVFVENTSKEAVTLLDRNSPAWQLWEPWTFKLDGNKVVFSPRGSFGGADRQKPIAPGAKVFIASCAVGPKDRERSDGYVPTWQAKPGPHVLGVAAGKGIQAASIKVLVPEKEEPLAEPRLLLTMDAEHKPNVIYVKINLANPTMNRLRFKHEGIAPPWHTAPWYNFEVDGKPANLKLLIASIPDKADKEEARIAELTHWLWGEIFIPLEGWQKEVHLKDNPRTPMLPLDPGEHLIRVTPSDRWRLAGLPLPEPASIRVVVPEMKR